MGNKASRAPPLAPPPISVPFPELLSDPAPRPDAEKIPSPAFLVVGGAPTTQAGHRPFFSDTQYYIFDKAPLLEGYPELASRYIQSDFEDYTASKTTPGNFDILISLYENKFDIIIFDYSVAKFMRAGFLSKLQIDS